MLGRNKDFAHLRFPSFPVVQESDLQRDGNWSIVLVKVDERKTIAKAIGSLVASTVDGRDGFVWQVRRLRRTQLGEVVAFPGKVGNLIVEKVG